jgi:glutamyl-tRNA synthetase
VAKYWKPETPGKLQDLLVDLETVEWTHVALEALYRRKADEGGYKFAELIHPSRLAVSGMSFGPGLFELLEALGRDAVVRRIQVALKRLAS